MTLRGHRGFERAHVVRYSNVWEDAEIACEALRVRAAGGRLLAIASAGDLALALLLLDPCEITAIDINPAQLACLDLRMAAIRLLDYGDLLAFLGVTDSHDRWSVYRRLRPELGSFSRSFFDAHPGFIERGVLHCGRFEAYLTAFRRWILPAIHPRSRVRELLAPKDRGERIRFFRNEWDTRRWRFACKLLFGDGVLDRQLARPRASAGTRLKTGGYLLERIEYLLTEVEVHDNPYLTYLFTGNFSPHALPLYLREAAISTIRDRLHRVRVVRGSISDSLGEVRYSGMYLSNVFDYMNETEYRAVHEHLVRHAQIGARLIHLSRVGRNPNHLPHVRRLSEIGSRLQRHSRAGSYASLYLEEVTRSC